MGCIQISIDIIKHHNYVAAISGNSVRARMAGITPAVAAVIG
jgi:hypothetical protein